jgi:hypothetical protein
MAVAIRCRDPEQPLKLDLTSAIPERQFDYSEHTSSS